MRGKNALAFIVCFALSVVGLAQGSDKVAATSAPAKGKPAVAVPSADLKWMDLDPAKAPGLKTADVWGDHTKGAFGGFTKFPAGFAAPLHIHTHDMKLVVVSGTFIHTPEGKPEVRLGPGSYLFQPGNYRHTTACDKASECVVFIQSTGRFDLIPVEEKK